LKTVIQFTGMTSDKYGSIEKFNEEVAKQLNEKGYKTYFVYNEVPTNQEYVANLQSFNAEILTLSINWSFWEKIIAVLRILLKYKPEIVHCHFSFPLIRIIIPLSWLLCVPKRFITIHSMLGRATFLGKCWFKMLGIFSTKIFTVSDAIKNQLRNDYQILKKIKTLRLGIDLNKFDINPNVKKLKQEYGLPADKFVVGCVAFHQPIKGIDVLLRAMSVLKYDLGQKDVVLCQVGGFPGDYSEKLYSLTKELKIENEVIWLGRQDNVPDILKTFDVYCQPSRSEGLGLAIVEALASKLPVVAANVGGIPEVVENEKTGFLVENENPKEMAEKINILLNFSELRDEFGAYGYNMAHSQYDRNIQVEKLIEKYFNQQQ